MTKEEMIRWRVKGSVNPCIHAFNSKGEHLGKLKNERFGRFFHWCWYQREGIRMSPGCLQEVREKQILLFNKEEEQQ